LPKDRTALGEASLLRLRQVADRYPRFLAVQNVLAQMYGAAGKYDDAVTIATRAMQTSPTAAEPAAIAAGALGSLGRWSQVLGVAEQWRQRTLANPIAADVIIATADLMLRDPAKAQQQLEIYLERAKAAPDRYGPVLVSYAQALCAQRKFTAAADLLGPLLATSPQLRLAWIQLASEAVAQVEIPTAAQWLDSFSQRITSPTIDEQAVLAQAWWRLSQRSKDPLHAQKARQVLDSATSAALASDKPPTQALLILAMTHEAGGDVAAAEQIYRRVLTIDPAMMVAQNNLAVLIMDRGGNLNEALDLARKASSVNHSGHASALETLASIQAKLKDYAHAVENLDAALRVSPEKMDWRIERVQFLADGGQSAKARSALDEVERLRPDPASLSPSSRDMLQSLRQQFGLAVGNPPTTRPALSDVHQ
jgi:tetratricopeptide (TPR) repeat protein